MKRLNQARLSLPPGEQKILNWATAVFLAIILDGAARKWLLPQSLQGVAYVAKDVLAAIFVLSYRFDDRQAWAPRLGRYVLGISVLLAPALLLGLFEVPVGAILIYKNAVLWPLFAICLGQRLTEGVVRRILPVALICTVGMSCLAIAQYYSPADSLLNRYAWADAAVATHLGGIAVAGDFVRATGTFSYIAGLGAFSLTMFCVFLGQGLSMARGRELVFASGGAVAAAICGLATGNRGAQVFIIVVCVVTLVLAPKKKRHAARLVGGLIGAAALFLVVWNTGLSRGVAERWSGTDQEEFRGRVTNSSTSQPLMEILQAHPAGQGLGIYSGFSTLAGNQDRLNLAYNESGTSRASAEAGALGIGALALGFGLILRAASWMSKSKNAALKTRLVPIFAGMMIALIYGLWYDHNATALWWWTIAIWLGQGLAIPGFRAKRNMVFSRSTLRRDLASVPQPL